MRGNGVIGRTRRIAAVLGVSVALNACSAATSVKDFFIGGAPKLPNGQAVITGFLGGVAADEPSAALVGRQMLSLGGNAADAAAAMGFVLSVTLPSRAGLGGGGACLAYNPSRTGPGLGAPEAMLFVPIAAKAIIGRSDRPASVPMMARGLFALQARYGRKPFETVIAPAEQMARFGAPVSRAFLADYTLVSGPLSADPNARAVFGAGLREGGTLIQSDLGATLAQLRVAGVGDLYQGALAARFVEAANIAGGGLALSDLRAGLPRTVIPLIQRGGNDSVAFLPPPADGGLAAAASFQALRANPGDLNGAKLAGLAAAARWRQGGIDSQTILASPPSSAGASLPLLPASTSYAVLDRDGNAVVCVATMDNLFGTGRVAPGTGILLAAAPATDTTPLLAAALAWNPSLNAFRAAIGGSGQDGAALAVAAGMADALRTGRGPAPVPEPGRLNATWCGRYLPGSEDTCGWSTDGRASGLALGSN